MDHKKTLVIGANENPQKYANMAVRMLLSHGYPVVALGIRPGKIENVLIETEQIPFEDIHTVTIYVSPDKLVTYYKYILDLKPERVIFNPGTEDPAFMKILQENNIEGMYACTLVMLQTRQF